MILKIRKIQQLIYLEILFKRFFKEVWESERYNISKFKEEAIIRISDLLNYINILKSTVEK